MRGARGFTLIELVIVIVLLAIVATISVQFVSYSTQGAIDTGARQQRALAGVVISEQITRALREAFPLSIRTGAGGSCIEWMPIIAASNYIDLPATTAASQFNAVGASVSGNTINGRVVVYGHDAPGNQLYAEALQNDGVGPISPPAAVGTISENGTAQETNSVQVTWAGNHRFSNESPQRRFHVLGAPETLCQQGNRIVRANNYGINAAINTAPAGANLAANIQTGSLAFNYQPATLQRGAIIVFSFAIEDPLSGETMAVSQEVQVRNVP
ncbi:PulJ/GspJ family protein [Marinobacter fonticola]|uniref:PulJ/GspJ family protein n=1 Tax=Marinobacter fonticola TaxID=2603215 RepID=UPI0011E67DA5|nr:type II secretion system protein [Marinobacter fonticola]